MWSSFIDYSVESSWNSDNQLLSHASNHATSFAILDYEAHINTKIDYLNHVFKTMTIAEINSLQTIFEVEITPL